MNAGAVACALALALFLIVGIVFALLKGKAALLISGFNSLSERERAHYDQEAMAVDMRNACFLWALIMAIGCALSFFLTPYAAIAAFVVWLVLFFKDVRLDAGKAFEKYRKQ
ncbi:MAG: DUF3784 domain-containing protein [Eggerthellaceae bacterium]|nr:DUF3784 domain-containing protein [Eggerthellaceae bacterium]